MWFHPNAEALFEARRRVEDPYIATVNGERWTGANMSHVAGMRKKSSRGGAWDGFEGIHLTWDDFCVNHERELFHEKVA